MSGGEGPATAAWCPGAGRSRGCREGRGAPWLVSSGFLLDCKHSPVPGERQSWGEEGDAGWPRPGDAVGGTERRGLGREGGAQFGLLALLLPCTLLWGSLWHPCAVPGKFWELPQNVIPQPGEPRPAQSKTPRRQCQGMSFMPRRGAFPSFQRWGVTQAGSGSPHGAFPFRQHLSRKGQEEQQVRGAPSQAPAALTPRR